MLHSPAALSAFRPALYILVGILAVAGFTSSGKASPKETISSRGKASFYGGKWHGRKTANGEIYNQNTLTAAHRSLDFGTEVKVRNLRNGREVVVRINNRGPHVKGRIIDLSTKAAQELRMTGAGVVPVEITVVKGS